MTMALSNEAHQRGLRDFLQLYNTITGFCFDKCVSNFNDRRATPVETSCIDTCTDNYVQFNQRLMFNFMDHQERRKSDLANAAAELAAKEAAALQNSATMEQTTAPVENDTHTSQNPESSQPLIQNSGSALPQTSSNSESVAS